jgi:hypothetical protein
MELNLVINPSRFFEIVRGLQEGQVEEQNDKGYKAPRYFLEIDRSLRESPGYKDWVAEKELEIGIGFVYLIDGEEHRVSLILRGRPDFYDPQQGVVLEIKKQPFPEEGEADERFEVDLRKAWIQVGLYAFMLYFLGFKVQAVGVQFLWPGEAETDTIVLRGWKIPVPESIEQSYYCDVVPFTEDDVAEIGKMLWETGLMLLLRHICTKQQQ